MSEDITYRITQCGARIAGMWPIFGISDTPADNFTDAIEFLTLPPELAKFIPNYHPDFDPDDIAWEEVFGDAWHAGERGWLVLAHVPVYKAYGDGNGVSYSWGHYNQTLLYGATPEACFEAVIAYERERMDAAKAKGGAS